MEGEKNVCVCVLCVLIYRGCRLVKGGFIFL